MPQNNLSRTNINPLVKLKDHFKSANFTRVCVCVLFLFKKEVVGGGAGQSGIKGRKNGTTVIA